MKWVGVVLRNLDEHFTKEDIRELVDSISNCKPILNLILKIYKLSSNLDRRTI